MKLMLDDGFAPGKKGRLKGSFAGSWKSDGDGELIAIDEMKFGKKEEDCVSLLSGGDALSFSRLTTFPFCVSLLQQFLLLFSQTHSLPTDTAV